MSLKVNPADHTEPVAPCYADKNRNGVLSLYGLGRWCNLTKKLILKAFSGGNWGFIYAAHTSFDSMSQCLYQSKWSSFVNTNLSLLTHAYYTQYGNSSYYCMKRVQNLQNNAFIGHEIIMNVAINRAQRKKKALEPAFKEYIDANWSMCPNEMRAQYSVSKNVLQTHMSELQQLQTSDISQNKLIYSYQMQLRYFDEDRNHHLNSRKYYEYIEEALMSYDQRMANNAYLNYSLSIVYWKETPVSKYEHCFVNICRKVAVVMKNERNNKEHIGWDFYGLLSVCNCCRRGQALRLECEPDHKHDWTHQTGFVLRVFDKKANDPMLNSKL